MVGGLLCGRAVYCALTVVSVCVGNVVFVRALYCVVGRCIVC